MSTRSLVLPLLFLALSLGTPVDADQVVLKNGSVIEGDVTVDKLRKQVHVKKKGGVTFSFSMSEVVQIVEDEGQDETPGAAPKEGPKGKLDAVVIPLHGGFDHVRAREDFDEIVSEAVATGAKLIVFEISSPGGSIAVAEHFARTILALDCRTAAFVSGPTKGAYSAAAYVALSCDRIYMAPGQALGAAVAWQAGSEGAPEAVNAKFNSAWQASFRATAEANGHPTALAQAMVSAEDGVAEVIASGQREFVPASRFYKRAKDGTTTRMTDPDGVKVRILCKPGKVLTLTSREARRVGMCRGIAADTTDFLSKLRVDTTRTRRLEDPLSLASAFVKKEQAKLDKAIAEFNKRFEKLVAKAPGNHNDYELENGGAFKDGGRAWRRRTKASLSHIKKLIKKLDGIQQHLEKYPDLRTDRRAVAAYAVKLRNFEKELRSLRYIKKLPRRR